MLSEEQAQGEDVKLRVEQILIKPSKTSLNHKHMFEKLEAYCALTVFIA